MRDPWSALGISRGASRQQIKEAYRRLALKCHPDLCEASARAGAEVQFKIINEARTQLLASAGGTRHRAYASSKYTDAAGAAGAGAEGQAFSNGFLAAILSFPLILTGVWMSRTMPGSIEATWRHHGIMQRPINPYLREDLEPRVKSRFKETVEEGQEPATVAPHAA